MLVKFSNHFIANFLLSVTVKEIRKSVNIWWNCDETWQLTFWTTLYVKFVKILLRFPVHVFHTVTVFYLF